MTNYRFTFPALVELREATLRYEEQQKGLGAEFLGEIDATVDRILVFRAHGIRCLCEHGVAEVIDFPSDCFIKFGQMRFLSRL